MGRKRRTPPESISSVLFVGTGGLDLQELLEGHIVSQRKLKEVLGHTPLQVVMGAVVGIVSGVVYSMNFGAAAMVAA